MKCPICEFVCSDLRDLCPKCYADLRSTKRNLGLTIVHPNLNYNELVDRLTKDHRKKSSSEKSSGLLSGLKNIFSRNKQKSESAATNKGEVSKHTENSASPAASPADCTSGLTNKSNSPVDEVFISIVPSKEVHATRVESLSRSEEISEITLLDIGSESFEPSSTKSGDAKSEDAALSSVDAALDPDFAALDPDYAALNEPSRHWGEAVILDGPPPLLEVPDILELQSTESEEISVDLQSDDLEQGDEGTAESDQIPFDSQAPQMEVIAPEPEAYSLLQEDAGELDDTITAQGQVILRAEPHDTDPVGAELGETAPVDAEPGDVAQMSPTSVTDLEVVSDLQEHTSAIIEADIDNQVSAPELPDLGQISELSSSTGEQPEELPDWQLQPAADEELPTDSLSLDETIVEESSVDSGWEIELAEAQVNTPSDTMPERTLPKEDFPPVYFSFPESDVESTLESASAVDASADEVQALEVCAADATIPDRDDGEEDPLAVSSDDEVSEASERWEAAIEVSQPEVPEPAPMETSAELTPKAEEYPAPSLDSDTNEEDYIDFEDEESDGSDHPSAVTWNVGDTVIVEMLEDAPDEMQRDFETPCHKEHSEQEVEQKYLSGEEPLDNSLFASGSSERQGPVAGDGLQEIQFSQGVQETGASSGEAISDEYIDRLIDEELEQNKKEESELEEFLADTFSPTDEVEGSLSNQVNLSPDESQSAELNSARDEIDSMSLESPKIEESDEESELAKAVLQQWNLSDTSGYEHSVEHRDKEDKVEDGVTEDIITEHNVEIEFEEDDASYSTPATLSPSMIAGSSNYSEQYYSSGGLSHSAPPVIPDWYGDVTALFAGCDSAFSDENLEEDFINLDYSLTGEEKIHVSLLFSLAISRVDGDVDDTELVDLGLTSDMREVSSDDLQDVLHRTEESMTVPVASLKNLGVDRIQEALANHDPSVNIFGSQARVPEQAAAMRRMLAMLIDGLVSLVFGMLCSLSVSITFSAELKEKVLNFSSLEFHQMLPVYSLMVACAIVAFFGYQIAAPYFLRETLGSRIAGIRIVREDFKRARLSNLTVRSLTMMLSLCTLGFLPILLGKPALHDKLSRTKVVH